MSDIFDNFFKGNKEIIILGIQNNQIHLLSDNLLSIVELVESVFNMTPQ